MDVTNLISQSLDILDNRTDISLKMSVIEMAIAEVDCTIMNGFPPFVLRPLPFPFHEGKS